MCVYMYAHSYMYVYAYIHVYTCIYTHQYASAHGAWTNVCICPLLKSTCVDFLFEIALRPVGPKVWLRLVNIPKCKAIGLTSVLALVAHARLVFEYVA